MPLKPGPRRRRDSVLYRALLLSEDEKYQTPLGVAYDLDGIKDVVKRNSEKNPGRVVVETADVPADLKWRVVRRA